MKPVPVQLETAERLALRRVAAEHGLSLEQAATTVLREWLVENGYLELAHDLDEETATVGSA
jgi:predicted AlkP superfamily phosphohydrolase/phosphomutase